MEVIKKFSRVFLTALITIISLQACQNNRELIEVEIPERETFISVEQNFPDPSLVKTKQGPFEVFRLPYKYDDVEEVIKPSALIHHYGRVYLNYANELNLLVHNTPLEKDSIQAIVPKIENQSLEFQNKAGGYYNHTVYWQSISPNTDTKPSTQVLSAINSSFGGMKEFEKQVVSQGMQVIGSGWVWLIREHGVVSVVTTMNNELPLSTKKPSLEVLFAIDLWEHAYMETYKEDRKGYLIACVKHLNWDYINANFNK